MAVADPKIGQGSVLTFNAFVADIRSMAFSGESRDVVDVSHLGSATAVNAAATAVAFMEKIPSMSDPGSITFELWLDPALGPADPSVATDWPTRENPGSLKIEFPDTAAFTELSMTNAKAYANSFTFNITPEGAMEATMVVKLSGVNTYTQTAV